MRRFGPDDPREPEPWEEPEPWQPPEDPPPAPEVISASALNPARVDPIIDSLIASSVDPDAVAAGPDVPQEPSAAEVLGEPAARAREPAAEPAPEPAAESSAESDSGADADQEATPEAAGADEAPHAEAPDGGAAEESSPQPSPSAEAPQPSPHAGMGAVLHGEGVSFRVWAPHAEAVSVVGTFNDWNADAHPLAHEGNGYWSADLPGAKAGDEYRFAIRGGGQTLGRIDPYARDVTSSVGNAIVVDPAFDWGDESGYRMPPWNELVVYELHVGTFNDQPGDHPGSFASVIARLPYLRELGVNCIELMPSVEFAADFSWGYNPAHIFAIESAFGGPADLKRLVKAAHEHGIAVIFDVVYNHFGPSDLDLWQFDGWSENGKGGIYFYNDHRSSTPWGDTRPDYGREEVRQFIRDNALMWLEEFRFDGLRWDATAYIRNVFGNDGDPSHDLGDGWGLMQRINRETDFRQPWKLHVAEDLRNNGWIVRDAEAGGAGFDTQWDGEFVHPVRRAVVAMHDEGRSMEELRRAVEHRYEGDPCKRVIYTESHDEVANGHARVPEEIWPGEAGSWFSRKRSTLGAALVFTSPGIPMLFQGQEILEDRWFEDGDPIDWTRLDAFGGVHLLYGDLVRLRRNWFDTTRGLSGPHVHVHHVNDADKVLAFHRWEGGGPRDDVVVLLNFANRAYDSYVIGFPRGGEWKVRLNSDWSGYGADYGDHPSWHVAADGPAMHGMPASGSVSIGPYTAVILSQDE
ncbi:MAG TPA: alpha-amylase family glycosyl hydrolase [Longimicrobium sp.]|jgi:1,4-alpha-glucan branching enzyme